MKNIGVFVKKTEPEALMAVRKFLDCFKGKGFNFLVERDAATVLKIRGHQGKSIPAKSDLIIVFGGDGTILGVARLAGSLGVPILGVNLGGLGFITELRKDEICDEISKVVAGECSYEERIMLSADVYRGNRKVSSNNALNDVVMNKSALSRMFEFDIHNNGQYVSTFRADGLIVSTPTGSTAHSLSAGGPIIYPTLETFLVTPICPHTLTSRPIVLPDSVVLEIRIKSGKNVYMTLDGQVGFPLLVKDRVKIKKAQFKAKFVVLHDKDYFHLLRSKLKWGEGL